MDTATGDRLGADEWALGPSVVLLAMPGNWVIGSLLSQVWSIVGSGDADASLFTWQYFANYNLPGGWYISSSPIITANWEADRSGDTWTVPFGGGFCRVLRIGGFPPLNLSAQGFYNAWRPDSIGRWRVRLQAQLLFSTKR